MSKEVQMTIRIEPALRAEFTQAAMRDHRPASQVLRELMRSYIKTVGEKDRVAADTTHHIHARMSGEVQGFKLSAIA